MAEPCTASADHKAGQKCECGEAETTKVCVVYVDIRNKATHPYAAERFFRPAMAKSSVALCSAFLASP